MKETTHKVPHDIWFHFNKMSRISKFTETENRSVVAWDWRMGWMLMGIAFTLGWWKYSEIDCDYGCTTLCMY